MKRTIIGAAFILSSVLSYPNDSLNDIKPEDRDIKPRVSQKEVECLAKNIYHEARGESIKGMIAVAFVTLNRAFHPDFPESICSVVYQKYQFSWTLDKKNSIPHELTSWNKAVNIAKDVLHGRLSDPTGGSLYFHTKDLPFRFKRAIKTIIGNHIFYK